MKNTTNTSEQQSFGYEDAGKQRHQGFFKRFITGSGILNLFTITGTSNTFHYYEYPVSEGDPHSRCTGIKSSNTQEPA